MGDFYLLGITKYIHSIPMGARSYFLLDNEILSTDEMYSSRGSSISEDKAILEGKSILIIDDSPINLSVAEKTLSKYGAECFKAFSAKEGILSYVENDVDLVLMDLHMPMIDGFEATRMIRETSKFKTASTPILAYTTYAYNEVKEAIKKYGLDGYIGKPFTQTQVLDTILSALD